MKYLKLYNKKSKDFVNFRKDLFLLPYTFKGDEKLVENIFSKTEIKDKKYTEIHIIIINIGKSIF